jgi:hypothetical protein
MTMAVLVRLPLVAVALLMAVPSWCCWRRSPSLLNGLGCLGAAAAGRRRGAVGCHGRHGAATAGRGHLGAAGAGRCCAVDGHGRLGGAAAGLHGAAILVLRLRRITRSRLAHQCCTTPP